MTYSDAELDAMTRHDNESPSIKQLKRELDTVTERAARMEALLNDMGDRFLMQQDGRFLGDLAPRINPLTGRAS